MSKDKVKVEFEIPEGVNVSVEKGLFTIKGEKGEVIRNLFHPSIKASTAGGKVVLQANKPSSKNKKLLHTYRAHIKNMMRGVGEGITYKLKVCASHFPMTVDFKDQTLQVKNYIGERTPRTLKISEKVSVNIDGEEIVLEGTDKELVGQTAASIEKLTRRRGFDRRIFQDGIYITEKDGREI